MKHWFLVALFLSIAAKAESTNLKLLPAESPKTYLLKDALEMALANNFELKKAAQAVNIARSKSISQVSEVLPKAFLRGNTSHTLSGTERKLIDNMRYGLVVEAPLFDIKNLISLKTQKESLDAEVLSYAQKSDALLFEVSKLYAEALLAQSVRDVALKEVALYDKQFTVFKAKSDLGVVRKLDVFRAEYLFKNAESTLATKELDFQNKLAALGYALNQQEFFGIASFQISSALFEQDVKSLSAMASDTPQTKALQKKLSSATYAQASEQFNFLPKASASIDAGWQAPFGPGFTMGSHDFTSRFMLNVEIPLFLGGGRWANIKSAQAFRIISEIELQENLQSVQLKVSGLIESIKAQEKALGSAEAAKLSAQSASESAERLFLQGEATGLEVMEANVSLMSANNLVIAATYQLELSKLNLLFLVGKIAEIM